MKSLIKIAVLNGLLLFFVPVLQAQTSVFCDTIPLVPSLFGGMQKIWNGKWYEGVCGEERPVAYDVGEGFVVGFSDYSGSYIARAYLTFELPAELKSSYIDSVFVYLYQSYCWGDDQKGKYPHWDVPDGDTIFCALDHVEFDTLMEANTETGIDTSLWHAGDPGYRGTLESYAAKLPKDTTVGFRKVDITKCVKEDIDAGRRYTQYRVAFPIETDNDKKLDGLTFVAYSSYNPFPHVNPMTFLVLWTHGTGVENNLFQQSLYDFRLYPSYPNPFNETINIGFKLAKNEEVSLRVYDIVGRLVKVLMQGKLSKGSYRLFWNGTDEEGCSLPTGLYILKLKAGQYQQSQKLSLIK